MEFAVLFAGQVAYPSRANEQRVLRTGVDHAILADRLGFDRFYVVEPHSLEGYAHSSAPEMLLSYIAAKTERIRIAHGIVCLPFKMNHPVRVAERAAMLDILSGGRLDVGVGRSSSAHEQQAFGITDEETYPQMEAGLRAIVRMWTEEAVEFSQADDLIEMPLRTIRPQPVQHPHPPLAMARTYGLKELRYFLQSARRWAPGGSLPDPDLWADDELETALVEMFERMVKPGSAGVGLTGRVREGTPESLVRGRTAGSGTPRDTIEFVEKLQDVGVDEVYFLVSLGGSPTRSQSRAWARSESTGSRISDRPDAADGPCARSPPPSSARTAGCSARVIQCSGRTPAGARCRRLSSTLPSVEVAEGDCGAFTHSR
jgi:hypothetical protein